MSSNYCKLIRHTVCRLNYNCQPITILYIIYNIFVKGLRWLQGVAESIRAHFTAVGSISNGNSQSSRAIREISFGDFGDKIVIWERRCIHSLRTRVCEVRDRSSDADNRGASHRTRKHEEGEFWGIFVLNPFLFNF